VTWDRNLLRTLLEPKSVAVVGASDDPTKIGGRPVQYLNRQLSSSNLFAVNPTRDHVQGLVAVPSLDELHEPVDLCVFATPAAVTVDIMEQEAGRRFCSAVIFGGGFAEAGPAGGELQRRLRTIAFERNVPVVGPNCLGYASLRSGMFVTFASAFNELAVRIGTTALLCQSGGFAINMLVEAAHREVGLSRMISTGNEATVGVVDFLEFLAGDELTNEVVLHLEGVADGRRLARALALLRDAGKPVFVLKMGRSAAGSRSVVSHTALAAGVDGAYDAVFERYGAIRLNEVGETIDVMAALPLGRTPGPVTIATMSGGAAAYMADLCSDVQLQLHPLPRDVGAELRRLLPWAVTEITNPIDLTGNIVNQPSLLRQCLSLLLAQDAGLVVLFLGGMSHVAPDIISDLVELQFAHRARLGLCWYGVDERVRQSARRAGLTTFDDPARLLRAWATLSAASPSTEATSPTNHSECVSGVIGEATAMSWLADAGIPVPPHRVIASAADIDYAFASLSLPLVMKIVEPVIAHRAAVGGVVLGLDSKEAVLAAWNRLASTLGMRRALLAEQVQGSTEVLVGVQRDRVFGLTAVVGPGGVRANETTGHARLVAPFDSEYLSTALTRLARWREWAEQVGGTERLIAQLGRVLAGLVTVIERRPGVEEIEVNPVLLSPHGPVALDGLAFGAAS
jgi:acetate---CoA ligase (ADP-forming)